VARSLFDPQLSHITNMYLIYTVKMEGDKNNI